VFGRRRKKRDQETDRTAKQAPERRTGAAGAVSFDNEIEPERPAAAAPKAADRYRANGPWDAREDPPAVNRMDLGSLRLPAEQGTKFRIHAVPHPRGGQRYIVNMAIDKSLVQVQGYAAPKTSGLWDEKRREITAQIDKEGGKWEERDGTFGTEIRAVLPVRGRTGEDGKPLVSPVRYLGVDGPRWLLTGMVQGEAAFKPEKMSEAEQLFAGVVVVRGDQPIPSGDELPIVVPKEIREQMAATAKAKAAQRAAGGGSVNGDAPGGTGTGPTRA
jgi:hypothetical protein